MPVKLVLRNARRSLRLYFVYLLTMLLVTALMFAFHSMIFSGEIQKLSQEAGMLGMMIGLADFFIILLMIWLIHYMVRFMAQQRGREFGIYLLLGFHKKQVARLFLLENMALGAAAFALGLLPGVFISQALISVIYGLLNMDYAIHLAWDFRTFFLTAGVYAGAYVLALFRNKSRFKRMDIRDLVNCDRENEESPAKGKGRAGWLFFVSAAYILLFMRMLYSDKFTDGNVYPLVAGLIAAVYLLYAGLSSFLVFYIRREGAGVWRGANIFILRQLSGKIRTMRFTMGTLTILFSVALTGASCAMMLNRYQATQGDQKFAFDAAIYHPDASCDFEREEEILSEAGAREIYSYRIYQNGSDDWNRYMAERLGAGIGTGEFFRYDTYMRLSDYNALRRMLGYEEVSLGGQEYLLQAKERAAQEAKAGEAPDVVIGGTAYAYAGSETIGFEQNGHNGADYLLVVPDGAVKNMTPYYSLCMAQLSQEPPEDLEERLYAAAEGEEPEQEDRGIGTDPFYSSNSRIFIRDQEIFQMQLMMSIVIFPLFYIGLVFLCAALTVLAVQQLSDAGRRRRSYEILEKMGMTKRELSRTVVKQLSLYYLCPFFGALLLGGGLGGYIGKNFFEYSGVMDPMWSYFLKAVLLFGAVYLIYFFITCAEFIRRITYRR